MSQIYRVQRDKHPDLAFEGDVVARVSSDSRDSWRARWTELELYRTNAGKWVAVTIGRSRVEGETDRHAAVVCENLREVFAALGMGRLARQLYVRAELETPAEWVD